MKKVFFLLLIVLAGCACPPSSSPVAVVVPAPEPAGDLSEKETLHLAGGDANLRTLDSLLRVKN